MITLTSIYPKNNTRVNNGYPLVNSTPILTAEQSLLLDEPPGHLEGVPVIGLDPLVHNRPVQ